MTNRKIVIGSRGSELALWQSQWVQRALSALHSTVEVEIRIIKTKGDKILDSPLSSIGDKGLFTKELENALLDGSIDLAVHSLKDVPTVIPDGLRIAAVCERENVCDVFISHPSKGHKRLIDVPRGGIVATGSLRRRCQVLQLRPDIQIADIRGNLGTRIEKLNQSRWDGMILAKAGIDRLGRSGLIAEVLPAIQFLPAVGQGALAIESRSNDETVLPLVFGLDHTASHQATSGERAVLRRLEGGCQIPIGAYGRIENGELLIDAIVGSLDGTRAVRSSIRGIPDQSEQLGTTLAQDLLARGADKILEEIRRGTA
ncbi:MAG TPA: hydroxymethylbilane synthase [Bacteroidetes bacterium]|nr:hydroxymethylbilane synthase [Bacteroidota bacterium]